MKIWGGVPSCNRNLFRHQVSCLLVLQIMSYVSSSRRKRRKTWTKWEKNFGYNFHIWCYFTGILFSFHVFSAVKLLEVKMT